MTIEEIISYIDQHTNGLFAGFLYRDTYEFLESGVSDRYINLFYIRPLVSSPQKYTFSQVDQVQYKNIKYRLVVQVGKEFINVVPTMLNILGTIGNARLINYTDDTDGVFLSEYDRVPVNRDFKLYAFDFNLEEIVQYSCQICECITEKTC